MELIRVNDIKLDDLPKIEHPTSAIWDIKNELSRAVYTTGCSIIGLHEYGNFSGNF